jgi:hypothetical protein
MARWTAVELPMSDGFRFPSLCPACLSPCPEKRLRVRSEKGRLKAFYLFATKWEHSWVTLAFCTPCADKRKRWERLDIAVLLVSAIASLALASSL